MARPGPGTEQTASVCATDDNNGQPDHQPWVFMPSISEAILATKFPAAYQCCSNTAVAATGFEILSKGHGTTSFGGDEVLPDLYVRGAGTYSAKLNAENPLGTMQSIEHTLRKFEDFADQDRNQIERDEKALADYRAQADRPFEYEAKLRELAARQARLNAALDLDKSDKRAAQVEDAEVVAARPWQERVAQDQAPRVLASPVNISSEVDLIRPSNLRSWGID